MKKIIQKEDPLLRETAKEIDPKEITSPRVVKILQEMKIALLSQEDGVAIAAPQIGYSYRIFIIATQFLPKKRSPELVPEKKKKEHFVFINPVITKLSRDKRDMEEGCLSVRYLYGKVLRSQKATIVAYDENGNKFTQGASGLLAQIFQHEVDHLNGILFIDTARYVEEILPRPTKSQIKNLPTQLTKVKNSRVDKLTSSHDSPLK